jgi:hypothetical protein
LRAGHCTRSSIAKRVACVRHQCSSGKCVVDFFFCASKCACTSSFHEKGKSCVLVEVCVLHVHLCRGTCTSTPMHERGRIQQRHCAFAPVCLICAYVCMCMCIWRVSRSSSSRATHVLALQRNDEMYLYLSLMTGATIMQLWNSNTRHARSRGTARMRLLQGLNQMIFSSGGCTFNALVKHRSNVPACRN